MEEPRLLAHGFLLSHPPQRCGRDRPASHTADISDAILATATLRHAAAGLTLLGPLLIFTACGSTSETNITGPSQPKCQVQAASEHVSFSPDGGTGTIRVDTTRECTWSAKSDAAWVSLASPTSGQGEGSVQFTVAANADPVPRASAVAIEDQRLQLSQAARPCEFRLSSTSESVEATGGERTIQVTTGSAQCRWTSSTDASWISIGSAGEHSGNGALTFRVEPLAGPERTATIVVAGEAIRVDQGVGCSVSVGSAGVSVGSAGGPVDVPVSTAPGCPWAVASNTPWISVTSGSSGTGPGVASFRVEATDGSARTGTVTVAGQAVTITQSPGCAYRLDPASYAAPQAGGATAVAVAAGAGCTWSASSTTDWIKYHCGADWQRVRAGANPGRCQSRTDSFGVSARRRPGDERHAGPRLHVRHQCVDGQRRSRGRQRRGPGHESRWLRLECEQCRSLGDDCQRRDRRGNGQVQFSVAANPGPARRRFAHHRRA